MASQTFNSKRHDTAVSPRATFTPPADLNWDLLVAGTTATFIMRKPDDLTPKIKAAASITGAWTVEYAPVPADVDTIGDYDVEVEVVRPDGKKLTLPTQGYLRWRIEADLDNA